MVDLHDLRGPHAQEAAEIVITALSLSDEEAVRLQSHWDTEDDQAIADYLLQCKFIWDALGGDGRLLPVGWFETIFTGCSWRKTTKALHPIADAVCVTLARDLVSQDIYESMFLPWKMFTASLLKV